MKQKMNMNSLRAPLMRVIRKVFVNMQISQSIENKDKQSNNENQLNVYSTKTVENTQKLI